MPISDLPEEPLVDSTGIYFTPMLRHLDRGSQEVDNGHYLNHEYVFGATAAAALYRREMIDDVSIHGEFFDPDFFAYREDADVAWRAQLMGWRCIYTPARARLSRPHRAARQPARAAGRDQHALGEEPVPDADEEHDLRSVPSGTGLPIFARDLVVVCCCLLLEQSSLKSFWYLAKNWKRALWRSAVRS